MDKNLESLKAVIRKGFEKADSRNEYTNEPRPYFESQISAIAECLQEENYRKADDLLDEIAGLTGKCEALQKDNENLTRTLEEGREEEYEKSSMRENELHEPKISEKYFYVTMLNCQQCGEFLAKDERVADIPIDIRIKECKRKIPNFCPNCGARLKEVKE